MSAKNRRAYVAVRLPPEGLARIRGFAERETEGNISQMIRKLLTEAIRHRDARADAPIPEEPT